MRADVCKHFAGIQSETCEAGVVLSTVKDASGPGPFRWPCLPTMDGAPCATTCQKFQAPSADDVAQERARMEALIDRVIADERPPGVHVLTTGSTRNPIGRLASLDMPIVAGFGGAGVFHNGRLVIDGERFFANARRGLADREGWTTVRHAEKLARLDPRGQWRIRIDSPLWSATWERKRPGKWVCIEAGEGFA